MAKLNKKWVALCSTAIGAIYAAGFFATENQAAMLQPQQQAQAVAQTESGQPLRQDPSPAQTTGGSQPKRLYKDGTFQGTGSNRRGSIQVAVTVKNDKITDVEISRFAMHYSESDVVGLPGEVLQKQNALVENVSGATYSTRAFEDAVQDALSRAQTS